MLADRFRVRSVKTNEIVTVGHCRPCGRLPGRRACGTGGHQIAQLPHIVRKRLPLVVYPRCRIYRSVATPSPANASTRFIRPSPTPLTTPAKLSQASLASPDASESSNSTPHDAEPAATTAMAKTANTRLNAPDPWIWLPWWSMLRSAVLHASPVRLDNQARRTDSRTDESDQGVCSIP